MNVNADSNGFEYTLNDFYLTAFLICGFAKLEKIVVVDREKKKCGFVLHSKTELDQTIRDYFNDRLRVNPQKFKDKIVALKSLLHETKSREGLNNNNEDAREKKQ